MQLRDIFGATILLTTHLMEEADALCQRVAIMHHGTLRVVGVPSELKASLERADATLEDVFMHYAGDTLETGGGYRKIAHERRTAQTSWIVRFILWIWDWGFGIGEFRNPSIGGFRETSRPSAPRDDSDSPLYQFISFFQKTLALTEMEIRKLWHDPTELVSRAVQPGPLAAGLRASLRPHARHGHAALQGFSRAGYSRAERALHRHFLRHRHYLGARFRHRP